MLCFEINPGGQNLTGTIPEELAELDFLMWLTLSFNEFTGTIPGIFGELPYMQYFEVNENLLTGKCDSDISCPLLG